MFGVSAINSSDNIGRNTLENLWWTYCALDVVTGNGIARIL